MISNIFRTHKKLCIIFASILATVLLAFYLYAACLPGIWHRDTFLYLQDDGSFSGNSSFFDYEMNISQNNTGSDITFRVNDTVRTYRIISDEYGRDVEIYEDGVSVFKGQAAGRGDSAMLIDNDEGLVDFSVSVSTSNDFFTVPNEEEQFPSYTALYVHAMRENTDRRGNLLMAFFALLIAVFLIIDLKYPDLFFYLKYMWHVDGGSPSEFYRFGQNIGRIISVVAIVGLLIATFFVH